LNVKKTAKILCHVEDVNIDEFQDLVCQFSNSRSAWPIGTTVGTISGQLNNGSLIQGEDSVCLVPSS